ncbi:MAG: TatD family hydrolase [Bacilli bacterium]
MKFIDTHCHLNDSALINETDTIIRNAKEKGCLAVFNNADSLPSMKDIIFLSKKYPSFCYAVLGIHPEHSVKDDEYQKEAFSYAEEHLSEIKAIGEIGLDYHYEATDEIKKRQQDIFRQWIRFAKQHSLPIVVHSRDAAWDTFNIIKEEKPQKVDLHCYSSSLEIYREYLKLPLEFKIGIGGVVTFKNSKVLKEIVSKGQLDSFMTETDSPYLAPTPFRGTRNEPSYIPLIISEMAQLRQIDEETMADILLENGEKFYGIK